MDFSDVVAAACRLGGEPIPNTNPETGIAYGVASGSEVPEWFWDEAEAIYPEEETMGEEPASWIINDGDFKAESSDGVTVMVYLSPRVVQCRECSPCYPCAGDLGTVGRGQMRTYAFPEEESEEE